jgi:hypothetical protein
VREATEPAGEFQTRGFGQALGATRTPLHGAEVVAYCSHAFYVTATGDRLDGGEISGKDREL